MSLDIGFAVLFLLLVAIVLARSIVVVPPGKAFVVSVLGGPSRVLHAGMNFVTPIATKVAARVPLDEQMLDVPETSGHLRDGTMVTVKGSLRYRITDPLAAVKNVDDYKHALAELVRTHWKRALETDDVVSFDPSLERALFNIRAGAASWGIEAIETRPQTIMSEDGLRALQKRAALEREQRVLAWLVQRQQAPGPDGRPTTTQYAAYDAWTVQAMADHREEINRAARQG